MSLSMGSLATAIMRLCAMALVKVAGGSSVATSLPLATAHSGPGQAHRLIRSMPHERVLPDGRHGIAERPRPGGERPHMAKLASRVNSSGAVMPVALLQEVLPKAVRQRAGQELQRASTASRTARESLCSPALCPAKGVRPVPDHSDALFEGVAWAGQFTACATHSAEGDCIANACGWVPSSTKLPKCRPVSAVDLHVKLGYEGCGWYKSMQEAMPCSPHGETCDESKCVRRSIEVCYGNGTKGEKFHCVPSSELDAELAEKAREFFPTGLATCMQSLMSDLSQVPAEEVSEGVQRCMLDSLPSECKEMTMLKCSLYRSPDHCDKDDSCEWQKHSTCATQSIGVCGSRLSLLGQVAARTDEKAYFDTLVACSAEDPCKDVGEWTPGEEAAASKEKEDAAAAAPKVCDMPFHKKILKILGRSAGWGWRPDSILQVLVVALVSLNLVW
eukprot:TRINITY_DN102440_c0_g1_i1.p1 TRINITY_DN102440_c0_g1~~TRINITY_DN102440_c0_g1_i1.p1  ORF type:complete len:446 (-),score=86.50 TRINITY_DN102440_c0_g1_i1:24-1361(-)